MSETQIDVTPTAELSALELESLGIGSTGNTVPLYPDGKPGEPDEPSAPPQPSQSKQPTPAELPPDQSSLLQKTLDAVTSRPKSKSNRDYTGLPEEYHPLFERMSNDAYNRLYPEIKEYLAHKEKISKLPELEKELSTLREQTSKPPRYFDHEEAYLLSQDYREGLMQRAEANKIRTFWERQLEAVESDQEFHTLIRNPDGSLAVGPAQPSSPQAKAYILSQLQQAHMTVGQAEAQLKQIADQSRKSYSEYHSGLSALYDQLFKPRQQAISKLEAENLKLFPAQFQKTGEARLLAAALAMMQLATESAQQQQQQAAGQEAFKKAASSAGPTTTDLQHGVASGKKPLFSKEEEARLRAELQF